MQHIDDVELKEGDVVKVRRHGTDSLGRVNKAMLGRIVDHRGVLHWVKRNRSTQGFNLALNSARAYSYQIIND